MRALWSMNSWTYFGCGRGRALGVEPVRLVEGVLFRDGHVHGPDPLLGVAQHGVLVGVAGLLPLERVRDVRGHVDLRAVGRRRGRRGRGRRLLVASVHTCDLVVLL
ncbi:hypothetical protein ACFQVA_25880 [Actinomadura keratinilytica]